MAVEAVIFDWGGTLTPWHTIDLREQWLAYTSVYDPLRADELAGELLGAEAESWAAARDHHRSATLDQVFAAAGIDTVERGPRDGGRGLPGRVGAAHLDRPRSRAHAARPEGARAADRLALQHLVDQGAPRIRAGARRHPRSLRRCGLLQRDPVDQAPPGGVPGGDGGHRRDRRRAPASSSATVPSTTSTGPRRWACARCWCRTPTSRTTRRVTPRATPTRWSRASPSCPAVIDAWR